MSTCGDENYSFYSYFENMKNRLYRQVSGARPSGLFWPKYYYYWFYSEEKILYNTLVKRQKLGIKISDEEVDQYNKIRENIEPKSSYKVIKTKAKTLDNYSFDDIHLQRKTNYVLPLFGLGLFSYYYLKLSRYWLVFGFAPILVFKYYDSKFPAREELENFYNYVLAKRESDEQYKENKKVVDDLVKSNPGVKRIIDEVKLSENSLEENMSKLYSSYIKSVIN